MPGMTTNQHPESSILAGDFPRRYLTVTIAAAQVLASGAVLGEVTASGEYKLAASASADGSESPTVVLADAVDTTDGAAPATVMLTGDVRGSAVTLGTGTTLDAARKSLRPFCLFID